MLDFTSSVGVLNVTYCTKSWEEAMGHIDGDCSAWAEIQGILVDEVGSRGVLKFSVQCFPAGWLFGWGEDSLDDEGVSDARFTIVGQSDKACGKPSTTSLVGT